MLILVVFLSKFPGRKFKSHPGVPPARLLGVGSGSDCLRALCGVRCVVRCALRGVLGPRGEAQIFHRAAVDLEAMLTYQQTLRMYCETFRADRIDCDALAAVLRRHGVGARKNQTKQRDYHTATAAATSATQAVGRLLLGGRSRRQAAAWTMA